MNPETVRANQIRLLVVSPLATLAGQGPTFLGTEFAERRTARTPAQVDLLFGRPRRRFDVILVDLLWNDFDLEWHFDGLDVVSALVNKARREPIVLACQGHGFERSFLEEGRDMPDVHGLVLKSRPDHVLKSLLAAAAGGSYSDPSLLRALHPVELGIHTHFARSARLARIAGVIASGQADSYSDVAKILNISQASANRAPELFKAMLTARGELPHGVDGLTQASVFRWCGENAHFILSWCRRHADRIGLTPGHLARRENVPV